ncbi:proline-rich protein 5-like isoform X2 [Patagioenas fasciata]|uniref:proline-rich protein 5-like isoform X2 n=1 Tax=Patagioenas fasciata TaxID=372321 RepID=UPI003A99C5D0
MGSFRRPRPRFMSSPVLSDLPRFQAARQALQLSSNSAWNSVQTAVINVFKGGGLQNNELYTLNENIRRLLKSELGSFITDYFQNQLLVKGLLFIEEKVKLCEGEDRIDILSEIWDHYFTETLPTLQAIFYPVQGQELTIRQIALLGFRDLVLLKVKLEEILPLVQTKLPASIVQMLLILQSVHEPAGPSEGYVQLEELVRQVVSPYLCLCGDHSFSGTTCLLGRHFAPVPPRAEQEERRKMCLHYTTLAAVQYFSTNNLGIFKVLLWRWLIFLKLFSLPLSLFLSLFCFLRTNFFSHWTTCNADEAQ